VNTVPAQLAQLRDGLDRLHEELRGEDSYRSAVAAVTVEMLAGQVRALSAYLCGATPEQVQDAFTDRDSL
jgi:hypothetical protein